MKRMVIRSRLKGRRGVLSRQHTAGRSEAQGIEPGVQGAGRKGIAGMARQARGE